jgi:phage terminase large subunit-like protein
MRPGWLFDDSPLPDPTGRGAAAVKFLNLLQLTEGRFAGQRDWLQPWQARLVRRIYGDVAESGRRRIRTVYAQIPRGNGKTTLCGGLALLHLLGKAESEPAGQVIIAAGDREQASICFNSARRMVRADPRFARITTVTDSLKLIRHPKSDGILKAISSESYTKMGMSISCLICDELATWGTGDRDLYNTLISSQGKRESPLTIVITTAGVGRGSIAWDLYSYARRVAAGEAVDPSFLPVLFEVEQGVDWRDREAWADVNPAIASGFRSLEEMEVSAVRAEHLPAQVASFERLYLNRWLDASATPWLDLAIWDEGSTEVDLEAIEPGTAAWIGVDLSSTTDLTAMVMVVEVAGGVMGMSAHNLRAAPAGDPLEHGPEYLVISKFFVPEDGLRRRSERDGVPYALWADQGFLIATPGAVVDYSVVESYVADLAERFRVEAIAIDRWNSTATTTRLLEQGLPVIRFGQGFASMSPAVKETERLILSRRLAHDANPVLRWCLGNVAIEQDAAGNVKISKARSRDKVDGAVALAMAVGVASTEGRHTSVYAERPSFLVV